MNKQTYKKTTFCDKLISNKIKMWDKKMGEKEKKVA